MEEECKEQTSMPLIGDDAPKFKAKTTMGEINFPEDYKGKVGNTIQPSCRFYTSLYN